MNDEGPLYSTLVLFGKETTRNVLSRATFECLTEAIADLLATTGCKLTCRGTIQGEKGKNMAPRKGLWSSALREKWLATLGQGRFLSIELFDQAWREGHHPDAFGALHKHWGYGPGGYAERTKVGAENSITIALRTDLVENSFERLETAARLLVDKIDCFYGAIESDVPWDRPHGHGPAREDMIDIRWYNRTEGDYGRGTYRMEEMVPRLYRGNILSPSQMLNSNIDQLSKMPGVAAVEEWPLGLIYLRLTNQPEYGITVPAQFADFMRFIPQKT